MDFHRVFLPMLSAVAFFVFAGPGAVGEVEFSLDGVVELHALEPDRVPLWPLWSQETTRVCFAAVHPDLMQRTHYLSEIWVLDIATPPQATRLLTEAQGGTCHCLGFVPDSSAILFEDAGNGICPSFLNPYTAGVKTPTGITPLALDPSAWNGAIRHFDIRETANGCWLAIDLWKRQDGPDLSSIFFIPTSESGVPNLSGKVEVVSNLLDYNTMRVAISPTGNELLVAHEDWVDYSRLAVSVITGLDRIIAGLDPPITSLPDPRWKTFKDGPWHADAPSWSEDGSLIFYSYDFSGRFIMSQMNAAEADFDIMIVRLSDALAGNLVPTRLQLPGSAGCLCASRGGTRFVFAQSASPANLICATGLALSDELKIDGSQPDGAVVEEEFLLSDGAGTTVRLAPSTLVFNYAAGAEPTRVILKTPVAPLAQEVLPDGSHGLPVQRALRHNNGADAAKANPLPLGFEPPAELEVVYTDSEIGGLNENDLLVYEYNTGTGKFDRFLPLIEHDLENNRITVSVPTVASAEEPTKSVGAYAEGSIAVGVADSDCDGLSDGAEVRWDGDLGFNPYDAIMNRRGTDLNPWNPDSDGDGSRDGQEVTFGTDPFDPSSLPEFPASGVTGLAVLSIALAVAIFKKARLS